jgi:CheY-like chemotaxis protein
MRPARLEILLVEREPQLARDLANELSRRGHTVRAVGTAEEALALPAAELLVSSLDLDGKSGFDLLAELHERGQSPRTIFLAAGASVEACRRALVLGASDFLPKPRDPQALADFVRAVERVGASSPGRGEPAAPLPKRSEFRATWRRPATFDEVECAVRELLACLVGWGLRPAVRARIAGACAEILDNVQRHAYGPGAGSFLLEAELRGREVLVCVADEGCGFDPLSASMRARRDTSQSGLARAAALCESLAFDSALGCGTRVSLRFHAFPAALQDEHAVDLSEFDYLAPGMARRILETLQSPRTDLTFDLSPALAVCVGRMLAGAPRDTSRRTAPWS